MARRSSADWSELYPELLTSIAGRLKTRADLRHFRAVCKKWRSSTPQIPPNLPFLSPYFPWVFHVTPDALIESSEFKGFYPCDFFLVIAANTTLLLQPRQNQNPNHLKTWLITIEELKPGKFVLRNPLTRLLIENIHEDSPRVLDFSDYNVKQIRKAYNFRYDVELEYLSDIRQDDCYAYNKVVMFFNPDLVSPTADDCYALALYNQGKLVCMRLMDEEEHWYLRYARVSHFDDVVTYRGRVWCIDRKGRVYIARYGKGFNLIKFSDDAVCAGKMTDTRKRLVESSDGLYLIVRYHNNKLIGFRVYKMNTRERKWNEVKSLDGRILFVSSDCCFFASAKDFPSCGGNCIFFPKDHFPTYQKCTYPDEYFFSKARNELEIGVFHLDNGESALVSNYPGYSDIFWPPPKCLFPDKCSSTGSLFERTVWWNPVGNCI